MPRPAKNKESKLENQIKTYVKKATKEIVVAISKDKNCSEATVSRRFIEIGIEIYLKGKMDPRKLTIY